MIDLVQQSEIWTSNTEDGKLSLIVKSFIPPSDIALNSKEKGLILSECARSLFGYIIFNDNVFSSYVVEDIFSIENAVQLAIDAKPVDILIGDGQIGCHISSKGDGVTMKLSVSNEILWTTTLSLEEIGGMLLEARAKLIYVQQELPNGWWSEALDKLLRRQFT